MPGYLLGVWFGPKGLVAILVEVPTEAFVPIHPMADFYMHECYIIYCVKNFNHTDHLHLHCVTIVYLTLLIT